MQDIQPYVQWQKMEPKERERMWWTKEPYGISSKLLMIYISPNIIRHPVTKTFTTLHYTSPNYTSLHYTYRTLHFFSFKLHPTTLHYSLI